MAAVTLFGLTGSLMQIETRSGFWHTKHQLQTEERQMRESQFHSLQQHAKLWLAKAVFMKKCIKATE